MAVASNPLETFIWGAGGQKMSPEQVARQREIAAALMQGGMDYSPVGHWTQGLARASQGLVGGLKDRWAGEAEQRGREGFQSQWDSVFGGGGSASPVAAALAETTPALDAANQMAGAPVTDWLEYANQGATRNQPLAPELVNAMSFLPEMGVTMRVASGGQEASGPNRVGSTRHDHGNAGDVDFYQNGRKLDWNNEADLPLLSNIVSQARANGVTGIGAGDDYMGAGRFHIGFGNEAVWGAGGKSENAPDWLRAAYSGAPAPARTQVAQAGGGMGPYGAGDTSLERFGPDGERFTRSSPNEPWNRASHFGDGGRSQGGGNPSVAQLLSLAGNEWANPGQSSVVSALLGQAMQQQDPRYQQQLAMGELQMQQLQNQLNATPFQPRTLTPEEMAQWGLEGAPGSWVTTESGLPEQLWDGPPAPSTDFETITIDVPGVGTQTFNTSDPVQYDLANQLLLQGATEVKTPGVQVTTNVGGANVFDEAFAKADAQAISDISTAGMAAQRNIGRIDQLESLLSAGPSGFAAAAAQLAGEWGIQTEGLDSLQAAQAIINSLVPEQRQPGSGPMSDADLELFKQSLPRLINTPEGNRTIIQTMRAIAEYDAMGAQIANRARLPQDDPNYLSRSQVMDALQNRPNPLSGFKGGQDQGGLKSNWNTTSSGVTWSFVD